MAKAIGTKRAAKETVEKRPPKKQKNNNDPTTATSSKRGGKKPKRGYDTNLNQAFRFLDLPPEIRNHIYEVIADISQRTFPHTYPKRNQRLEDSEPPTKPLPFIGLTQTCTLLRKEFRPIWLSTHRFPPYALNGYLKAFFPAPLRATQVAPEVIQRIASYTNPAGTLRVWIGEGWRVATDLLRLLKFSLRFPKYNLVAVPAHPQLAPGFPRVFAVLVYNTNAKWVQYIRQHVITQVVMWANNYSMEDADLLRIVVRERYAPKWMKGTLENHRGQREEYVASLGLEGIARNIYFGVDYS